MSVLLTTASMLAAANVFMTIAWYAHLKSLNTKPWYVAALVSWGIALFEYLIQVPANRIGHAQFTVPQLKILQEIITLGRLRALFDRVSARAAQTRLPLGGSLPLWCRLFHVSRDEHGLSSEAENLSTREPENPRTRDCRPRLTAYRVEHR
jgi:uncharacterized protein (DUF486 family)